MSIVVCIHVLLVKGYWTQMSNTCENVIVSIYFYIHVHVHMLSFTDKSPPTCVGPLYSKYVARSTVSMEHPVL